MNIKVVGDIRTGKFQPSLTGNPIVDDALLENFCLNLRDRLVANQINLPVKPDHFFTTIAENDDIILMDEEITQYFSNEQMPNLRLIQVNHNDLIHGDVSTISQKIFNLIKQKLQGVE
ncbi:hypothetical protein [Lentilactobacillus sp. Marseille-Q4993]|uniref:hypothetical protein n=1 Tax=Lentilactobacillus sp. Marseille-Q4993 TaxID=3039492 RepID=UPI0024BC9819|nr:hypothetical protein [Lentilactobacillus sp. Marseille-Q4993]